MNERAQGAPLAGDRDPQRTLAGAWLGLAIVLVGARTWRLGEVAVAPASAPFARWLGAQEQVLARAEAR
jgi:hypothetical protein